MDTDLKAYELSKIFLIFHKRYANNKCFHLGTVKKTKWWNFFVQTILKFGNEKEWNPYVFMWAQFEKYEKILPYRLPTESAWKTFLELKHRCTTTQQSEKTLIKRLLVTFNVVKNWSLKNNYKKINVEAFFNDNKNRTQLKRNLNDAALFTVCKSFQRWRETLSYSDKDFVMSDEEFLKKRALIFSNKRILKTLRKALGNEFS